MMYNNIPLTINVSAVTGSNENSNQATTGNLVEFPLPQPYTVNAAEINKYLQQKIGKNWARKKGFTATFKNFVNSRINFDMITDCTFSGDHWHLSLFIAGELKNKIEVLKYASSYFAHHYKVSNFNNCRLEFTTTDKKPDLRHAGRIYPLSALPDGYNVVQ